MTDYKQTVEKLLAEFLLHPDLNSSAYGEQEAYSVSKGGVEYPRVYLSLIGADDYTVTLKLTVTATVVADLSNRLEVQSRTLNIIRELSQQLKNLSILKFDEILEYEPTRLYQEDQSEGWFTEFSVAIEAVDACAKFNPPTNP